ncbi:MAG: trypsin-like peptidase domain-containing protein [Bacteroidetes bacterium]|nr:trypsin-like peptidase domain-containing protein [Bacteroidota bacterium]
MNGKKIFGTILIAIVGGMIALFAYSLLFEKSEIKSDSGSTNQELVKFTNLPADFEGENLDFTYAAERTVHAVVHVKTVTEQTRHVRNPLYEFFYGDQYYRNPQPMLGFGSGVITSSDGYIITNNHVVENSDEVEVVLNDKRTFKATVVGSDPSTDLALLKIKAKDLIFVPYGNSDELRLGDWVLAVGNPFNLTSTVTAGIVSAKGRNLGILSDQFRIESFIQTDAALNRGNSGGALVNTKGELVGINAAIISPNGGYAGNSFAIPVTIVKKVIEDLKEFGEVQRAILGITIQDVTDELVKEKKLDKIEGVYINGLRENGAAIEAGIEVGDIVISINALKVNSTAELQEKIAKFRPKEKVKIIIKRKGKTKQFDVVLRNMQGNTGIIRSTDLVLGAKFEELDKDVIDRYRISGGVKIVDVGDGPLKELGLRKGYIITSINDKKVDKVDDIKSNLGGGRALYSIEGVQPNGTFFSYKFTN